MVYRDVFGGWRWEWRESDGEMRDSRFGYGTRADALAPARALGFKEPFMTVKPQVASSGVSAASVLCAHADAGVHDFLRDALRSVQLAVAPTGYEALKSINAVAFDAYVVDYWLPDWSGVSLCREIRRTDPNVPICVYTKAHSHDTRRRALRAGANVFLTMPQDARTVGERLEALLHARHEHGARAWFAAERAVEAELERQASCTRANGRASPVFERKIRTAALNAFLAVGGTRANFERMWAQSYTRAAEALTASAPQAA